jgi:hypothetical protein
MAYALTLVNPMRTFRPASPGSGLLARTDHALPAGETVRISGLFVKSYDHQTKLALKLFDSDTYLLVEEISDEVRPLAFEWADFSATVDSSHDEEERRAAWKVLWMMAEHDLSPALQRYLKPELQTDPNPLMATRDDQGPHKRPVL